MKMVLNQRSIFHVDFKYLHTLKYFLAIPSPSLSDDESRSKSFESFITHQPQFETLNQSGSRMEECRVMFYPSFRHCRSAASTSQFSSFCGLDISRKSQCIRENWQDKYRTEKEVDRAA